MDRKDSSKLNIAIIHPDLGIVRFSSTNYALISRMLGGAERLIVDAAVELSSYGHNVHIFTSHHDKTRCFEETVSGVYHNFFYSAGKYVLFFILVSVVIPLMKLKKSSKVVFYCHFPDLLLAQHTTVLRRIYRKPIDFLHTFKHLNSRGVRPAVLYPAVNVNQFDEPNATRLNFLSINRFERKKNIELAISAFSMVYTSQQDFFRDNKNQVFLIVAGGFDKRLRENVEYLEELNNLAEREGVSHRVKFITSCPTSERNTLLSECLCVLYTPKDEHFGIVPIEAMAAHKPVIACNSGVRSRQ
ncbi:hypothetical protein BUALT_Bualt11G0042400 [Buddleja alternifolia]|uniref:Alpha-1,3/1,6-mannosyltransferase ALG2 n=1 Tax=Buddleja alternifolia TaxID=168488 RepID=A0AAV6WZI4_9LAMI|nr:hypothetical protein BUALT_Bualt11G0042400 [Buddleja alternifolia]